MSGEVDVFASQIAAHLQELEAERAFATLAGLAENATYMDELEEEIDEVRVAYVAAAVTEIATLRGELSGRLLG